MHNCHTLDARYTCLRLIGPCIIHYACVCAYHQRRSLITPSVLRCGHASMHTQGTLVNSHKYNGMTCEDAVHAIMHDCGKAGVASTVTVYRIRDWLISRQVGQNACISDTPLTSFLAHACISTQYGSNCNQWDYITMDSMHIDSCC